MKTRNGQPKWEGRMVEILSFRSLRWGLDVLLSFGLSSVGNDKQQSKNGMIVGYILHWGKPEEIV